MADPVAYFTLQDLIDVMGEEVFMAIFDDHGSQSLETVKQSTQVSTTVRNAHAFVKSWMPNLGAMPADNTTPSNLSDLIRCAGLQVAQCFAYQRRPEYVRNYGAFPGGPMWKGCIEMLERIQAGTQRVPPDEAAKASVEFPQPNQGGRGPEQDGPKALVDSDPIDRTSYGDW